MKHILFSLPLALLLVAGCAPGADDPADRTEKTRPEAIPILPRPAEEGPADSGPGARVRAAVQHVRHRDLLTSNSFWTVFHGILGIGFDSTLLQPETNKRLNAIDYITAGGEIRGLQFLETRHGLDVRTGPPFIGQGHQDQFIAEMAQWGMPLDRKFVVGGKTWTYEDFVRHSQARVSVRANQELSWAILILAQYRSTDLAWVNEKGESLRFEDVVRYELDQPVDSAACGGTHRLFGLTWAYHLHVQRGGEKKGVWLDLAAKTEEYKQRARKFQNADGSFSSRYLAGPGQAHDLQTKIGSSGHVLEWLALALSDEELKAPWVEEAANALSLMILDSQNEGIESGALYHAAHGLQIYHNRLYGPIKGVPPPAIPPHPAAKPARP